MSQQDNESKTIDGAQYIVYMLPPRTARKILVKIVQTIAPAISGDSDSVVRALSTVADRLNDEDLDWIMNELAKVTKVNLGGDKAPMLSGIFDAHFKGKMGVMFSWFGFALKVQYGNFWSVWGDGSVPDIKAVLADLGSRYQSTSTGSSGDQS